MANLYAEDAVLMPPGSSPVMGRPGIKAFLGDDATNIWNSDRPPAPPAPAPAGKKK